MDPTVIVSLNAEREFLETRAGQAALITAANLLGRMTETIALAFDDLSVVSGLPGQGRSIHDVVIQAIGDANPFAEIIVGPGPENAYPIQLGANGPAWVAH